MKNFHVKESELYPFDLIKLVPALSGLEKYNAVALGDTHMGGTMSYLPSNCVDERNNPIKQEQHQKIMQHNLESELTIIGQTDIIFFTGDMVEGSNGRAGGMDLYNTNIDMQLRWGQLFIDSIIKILKPKVILGLQGSNYHVGITSDMTLLENAAKTHKDIQFIFGKPNLKFFLGEKFWFLAHTFGGSRTTPIANLDRQWKKIHDDHYDKDRTPDVIGHGHMHLATPPVPLKNGRHPVFGFIVPCQKLPDSHLEKYTTGVTEIGFLHLTQKGVDLYGRYYNTFRYWEYERNDKLKLKKKKL